VVLLCWLVGVRDSRTSLFRPGGPGGLGSGETRPLDGLRLMTARGLVSPAGTECAPDEAGLPKTTDDYQDRGEAVKELGQAERSSPPFWGVGREPVRFFHSLKER